MLITWRPKKHTTRFVALALAFLISTVWAVPPVHTVVHAARTGAGASLTAPEATALSQAAAPDAARGSQVAENYGRLDLSFEENRGQTDQEVRFLARGSGYTLFLTSTEAVFVLSNSDCQARNEDLSGPDRLSRSTAVHNSQSEICNQPLKVLRMKMEGANAMAESAGEAQQPGIVNYFIGNDPAKWRTQIPTFGRVRYGAVYSGVDMIYYGREGQLEYDFVVAPGADWRRVSLAFEGSDAVEVEAVTGDLLLKVGGQTMRQHRPLVYQEVEGGRREVESGYELKGAGRVGFRVGAYDRARPLVIDPVLVYSTYLGGGGNDFANGIAVDSAGNAYVTGSTDSANFPTANAFDSTVGGLLTDAFVTKLNAAGTARVYSTYLGGGDFDFGDAIAVDAAGNAYVTGQTFSTNFPTANPFQTDQPGGDAFVTKLSAAGTALVYSTYLGGSNFEVGHGIAVDSAGNAYVTGTTSSTNFPTASAVDSTLGGLQDAFMAKFNAAGTALVYSTYLGGGSDENPHGIAVDSAGSAYITGSTISTNFPTANPFQTDQPGSDAFVTKFDVAGTTLVYSTYLGGGGDDFGSSIAVDSAGSAYVTGSTSSTNYPTANPMQPAASGASDAFVTKLTTAGTALAYSTYLGGSNVDSGGGIAVDAAGSAYVTGSTGSANFPTANAIQPEKSANDDAFVTKLNAAGTPLVYSTFLGGSSGDFGRGIAVDASGSAYVAGATSSTNFPTVNPIQPSFAGTPGTDAFVAKIGNLIISGRVTDSGGNGIEGVTVLLGGTDSATTQTDATGNFQFTSTTPGGSYTVTPFKPDFTFSPSSILINSLNTNQDLLFIGTPTATPTPTPTLTPTPTPTPTPAPTPANLQFSAASYSVNESAGSIQIIVTRSGDTSATVAVDYATTDGTANDRGDYTTAIGRLRFNPGDTAKSFNVFITDDAFAEGNETVNVTLSNPSSGAQLGGASNVLTIVDNDLVTSSANPIDSTQFFVRQHYVDFFNREPDAAGLAFWVNNIDSCGANAACREAKRVDTSASFFLSIEFQETGFLVEKIYRASFNRFPRYREFIRDTQEAGRGIVVGQGAWLAQLEANKDAFTGEFVNRPDFLAVYAGFSNEQYIDALNVNTGNSLSPSERNALVAGLNGGSETRATALRKVVEDADFSAREFTKGFVLAQYIGYLRRSPDDPPDTNFAGFDFWLAKLNQFNGDFIKAEMVRAFIISSECRGRFGQ